MYFIFTECNPETRLACNLGFGRDRVRHSGGKFEVCKDLKRKEKSIGIIDEDPNKIIPKYVNEITEISNTNGIKILEDAKRNNYIVRICPELEVWILNAAKESQINPIDHELPGNPKELHDVISVSAGPGLAKFGKLLAALQTSNNPRIKALKDFLQQH